jgi:hypothetical protein
MVKSLNANQLKKMNKSYVCFLGEISVSQIIIKNALSTMSPSTYHHTFLALRQSTALNKIYVLRGQRNTLVDIQNGPSIWALKVSFQFIECFPFSLELIFQS